MELETRLTLMAAVLVLWIVVRLIFMKRYRWSGKSHNPFHSRGAEPDPADDEEPSGESVTKPPNPDSDSQPQK